LPAATLVTSAEARGAAERDRGAGLLADTRALHAKAMDLLSQAEAAKDLRTALMAVREAARCVELQGRLMGQIKEERTLNVFLNPQWLTVQAAVLTSLEAFPEARAAVVSALEGITR
jgi:hypothetical protein